MEESIIIVIVFALIYLSYRLYWHYFPGNTSFRHQQFGGTNVVNGGERLVRDRDEYFQYEKGSFPYLNNITEIYQESLSLFEKKIDKIKDFINEFEKAKELINSQAILNSLYTPADIKRMEDEIEKLRQNYNRHLNLFLELAHLNNQLLVVELYSQKSINTNNNKKRTILDTYSKKMRELQNGYQELAQRKVI